MKNSFQVGISTVLALLMPNAVAEIQALTAISNAARAHLEAVAVAGGNPREITIGHLDPRLRLPHCPTELVTSQASNARQLGHSSVNVRCEGDVAWSLFVPATVREQRTIAVAATALPGGRLLTPADIRMEPTWLIDDSRDYLDNTGAAAGRLTTRPFATGAPLTLQCLRNPRAVKRGATVTVALAQGPLAIHVGGVALQDGAVGDRIQVRNSSSKRIVEAVINADGSVVVR